MNTMAAREGNPYTAVAVPVRRQFASDNYAGICPEAWAAMEEANRGHVVSYGNDPWTQEAAD
jgi:threonine aldolase